MANDTATTMRESFFLLALYPLLAMGDTVVNAAGLGIAALIVATVSNLLLALTRRWLGDEIRMSATLLLMAGIVAGLELLMDALLHELRDSLGIFLPLLVANFFFVARAQSRQSGPIEAVLYGLKIGGAIALTLLILGFARELVGRGSVFHDAGTMLGGWAAWLDTNVFRVDMGFLLAMLPPGAFIALGLLAAARNWAMQRRS